MPVFRNPNAAYKHIKDSLNGVVNHFLDDFKSEVEEMTPIGETGRGSKGWRRMGKYNVGQPGSQSVIENRVPYIGILDSGSSRQAPRGMTDPAFNKLKNKRYIK